MPAFAPFICHSNGRASQSNQTKTKSQLTWKWRSKTISIHRWCEFISTNPKKITKNRDNNKLNQVSGYKSHVPTLSWRPEANFQCCSSGTIRFLLCFVFIYRQTLAWNSLSRLDRLASEPRGSAHLSLHSAEITVHTPMPHVLCGFWGSNSGPLAYPYKAPSWAMCFF